MDSKLIFTLRFDCSLSLRFIRIAIFLLNQDLQVDLDLGELDLTSQDEFILDEVDGK